MWRYIYVIYEYIHDAGDVRCLCVDFGCAVCDWHQCVCVCVVSVGDMVNFLRAKRGNARKAERRSVDLARTEHSLPSLCQ